MSIVENLGPTAATLGGGFFVGILSGRFKESNKINSCNSWIILSWIRLPTILSDS